MLVIVFLWEKKLQINYRLNDKFDFGLFFAVLTMIAVGLMAIYSATQNTAMERSNFDKQVISLVVGIIVFFFMYSLPTGWIKAGAVPFYLVSLAALVAVLFMGRVVNGQRSWIYIGNFSFQPAEMAKFGTVLVMAYYLTRENIDIDNVKDLLKAIGIGALPVFLIFLEPDLGSSIVFFGFILMMLFWKGISLFGLFLVLSPGLVAVAALFGLGYVIGAFVFVTGMLIYFRKDLFFSLSIFAVNMVAAFSVDYLYGILSPHQKRRIMSFIDPNSDPLGSGYNAIQAQIAIGSGGWFGKGYLSGNQTQLQYIPEQWTDFIFCVIGEEFGFVGSVALIAIYVFVFYRLLRHAELARDKFHSILILGVFSIYFIHFVINVGMAIGIMPVIGIPLPFISYGGTALLINMAMLGLVFNIYRSHKE